MSILYGNARLVYDVVRFYLGTVLFLYITLPLMVLWVIIGLILDPPASLVTGISIHVYINIIIFAISGFKSIFPIAVGMGSTRVQFLKSYYLTGLGTVFATILLLNVCQYVLMAVYDRWMGWSNILHPAVFFLNEYHFLLYFVIDLMVGLFLFGFTFLIYCIWHRLGTVYSLMILMALAFPILFLYYGGVMDQWFTWLRSLYLSADAVFTLFGTVGLAALLGTYPFMRNAPLQPKPGKN
jgi:hypothetical protein